MPRRKRTASADVAAPASAEQAATRERTIRYWQRQINEGDQRITELRNEAEVEVDEIRAKQQQARDELAQLGA